MYMETQVSDDIKDAYKACYGKDMPPVTGLVVLDRQQLDVYREKGITKLLCEFPDVTITSARPEYIIIDTDGLKGLGKPMGADVGKVSNESITVFLYRDPPKANRAVKIDLDRNLLAIQVCFNFKDIYRGMPFGVRLSPLYKD